MADCDCVEQGSEDLKSCIEDVSTLACSNGATRTPEELVARAIAPVKKQFLCPPPVRNSSADAQSEAVPDSSKTNASQCLVKEKKSKRQIKRERQQEKKSVQHLCPEVAKTSDLSSCPYKDNCRFSHDLEAFKAQKPADLEGECPFMGSDEPCPYGLTCRFAGTHKDGATLTGSSSSHKKITEMNGLKKDVQKLLWKNKVQFLKAEAQLKALGLLSTKPKKEIIKKLLDGEEGNLAPSSNGTTGNGKSCEAMDAVPDELDHPSKGEMDGNAENLASDELRPVKRLKNEQEDAISVVDEAKDLAAAATVIEEPEDNSSGIKREVSADGLSAATMECLKTQPREKKLIDFRDKLYLAPLTTVGNLPFRRVCKYFGADITCGEMAMCTNLLQGQASEWALLRRHSSEDIFGVQICGAYPDTVARTVELIERECTVDFIDINMGCPIDIVVNKGAGSALLTKPVRMKSVIQATSGIVDTPITIKVRTGYFEGKNRIDSLIADIGSWGATAVTIHGRTRQQRYSKLADWDYVYKCIEQAPESLQVLGNGDVFSYLDWNKHKSDCPRLSSCMIARGALVKPWIFTEIKEQRHWDITSGERLNILKDYVRFGLQHWGSDKKGVETTRHFLLELLSYTCRYVPVGLLDVIPQQLNWRPPSYFGRDDLETLMASDSGADWVRISEMLLGKVPDGFTFTPKHKSNAYDKAENG